MSTQDSVRRAQQRAGQTEEPPRQQALTVLDRPVNSTEQLRVLLTAATESIGRSLPDQRRVERFYQMVMVYAQRTPKLLECTGISILSSALICAQNGLELGPLGHAWLIPRRNKHTGRMEAQFLLGYLGEAELAMRSGEYEAVSAVEVCERDVFDYEQGFRWTIEHRPHRGEDRGAVTHVYAVAWLRGGQHHPFVVLTRAEVEQRRARSQTPDAGPWVTDWLPMARKTSVRALRPQLRLTAEAARVLEADGQVFRTLEPDLLSAAPIEQEPEDGEQPDAPAPASGPPAGPEGQQTLV